MAQVDDTDERFNAFYQQHLPLVFATALARCQNRTQAEDLAQETLLEALRNAHKLRDPGLWRPWLTGIARNVCLRWARSRGRELARTMPLDWETHEARDHFDLDVELERDDLATLLDRTLVLLPCRIWYPPTSCSAPIH